MSSNNDTGSFSNRARDEGLLSHNLAKQLQERIQNGELRDGDQLPSERELARQVGISRTVVREALKLLKALGLVRAKSGVGSFVSTSSFNILEIPLSLLVETDEKILKDLQQAREIFEPAIARLAAQAATSEDLSKLESSMEVMRGSLEDPYQYMQADNAFHINMAKASHNSVYVLAMNSIVDLLQETMWIAVHATGAMERAMVFHESILEFIRRSDEYGAYHTMQEHIRQASNEISSFKPSVKRT